MRADHLLEGIKLATAFEETGIEEQAPERRSTLDFHEIIDPDNENLAELLDTNTLNRIGQDVIRDLALDEASRDDWMKASEKALQAAMQIRSPKSFPWPNASNYCHPLLTVASVQFQARAYPVIVDGANLVKGRVLGPDPDGQKRARADRIAAHMTWQLLYKMNGWEEDTDRLLLMLPILGCVFRKTYYDAISACNRSDMVTGKDFVIDYWAKSIESAPRYTHIIHLYPHEASERIQAGKWLKVRVEGENNQDDDAIVDFYEQHRLIDLDGDGYPEPYVVTCTKEGEVARLVPCFGIEDVTVMGPGNKTAKLTDVLEKNQPIGDIIKIDRRQYFTKYGFIPAPDGSFYDIGFGTLLADPTEGINTVVRQLLDAGTLQNAQGGFIGSGVTIKSGNMSFKSGEWKRVDVVGGTLRENIVPLALPGPSQVLFNMLQLLIGEAEKIASASDALSGVSSGTEQPTTLLARIEQAQKVMTAIFKRIYRAFFNELKILRRLNRDYLDETEYFQLNDAEDAQNVEREDYFDEDLDVIPMSDPTAISDMQKLAKAEAIMVFRGDPAVNQQELYRRFFEATGQNDIKSLMAPEGPPPVDPKVIIEGARLALAKKESEAKVDSLNAVAAKALSDAAAQLELLGLLDDAAALAAKARELGGKDEDGPEPTDGPGEAGGLEGQPPDGGVPELSGGPTPPPDGSMGGGEVPIGGGAGGLSPDVAPPQPVVG